MSRKFLYLKVCIDEGMSKWYFETTEFSVFVACYGRGEMLLLMLDLEGLPWCCYSGVFSSVLCRASPCTHHTQLPESTSETRMALNDSCHHAK